MGLHVLTVSGMLIREARSYILRCHGCFKYVACDPDPVPFCWLSCPLLLSFYSLLEGDPCIVYGYSPHLVVPVAAEFCPHQGTEAPGTQLLTKSGGRFLALFWWCRTKGVSSGARSPHRLEVSTAVILDGHGCLGFALK